MLEFAAITSSNAAALAHALQAALDVARVGVWGWDQSAQSKLWTSEAKAIFGLPPETTMNTELFVSMLHPDDVPRHEAAWTAAMDPGGARTYQLTYQIRRANDGAGRWISSKGSVLFEGDTPVHIVGALRDITEERKAMAASSHLEAIVASSFDAIVSENLDGEVITWNAAATRMFGYSADEMIAKPARRLIPFDRAGEEDEIRARLRTGDPVEPIDTIRLHKDGREVEVSLSISPIYDPGGNIVGVSKLARDITDRQRSDQIVRDSEIRLRHAADAARMTYIEVDFVRGRRRTPENFERVIGYAVPPGKADFALVISNLLAHVVPDERPRVQAAIQELFAGKPTGRLETCLRGDDGVERWIEGVWNTDIGLDQKPLSAFITYLDVTDRKHAEEHVRLLMRETNHRAKNLLSVVQAIVRHTQRYADPATFVADLTERIAGLSACQDLLVANDWKGVGVNDLVCAQLDPFKHLIGHRIFMDGPTLWLHPAAAQGIGMALNELATNASKFGALSLGTGRVHINWGTVDGDKQQFFMDWMEKGGPPVCRPKRTGFGHVVMVRMAETAVGGTVDLEYRDSGVFWQLHALSSNILRVSCHRSMQ